MREVETVQPLAPRPMASVRLSMVRGTTVKAYGIIRMPAEQQKPGQYTATADGVPPTVIAAIGPGWPAIGASTITFPPAGSVT